MLTAGTEPVVKMHAHKNVRSRRRKTNARETDSDEQADSRSAMFSAERRAQLSAAHEQTREQTSARRPWRSRRPLLQVTRRETNGPFRPRSDHTHDDFSPINSLLYLLNGAYFWSATTSAAEQSAARTDSDRRRVSAERIAMSCHSFSVSSGRNVKTSRLITLSIARPSVKRDVRQWRFLSTFRLAGNFDASYRGTGPFDREAIFFCSAGTF